jgi:hypothetical protein
MRFLIVTMVTGIVTNPLSEPSPCPGPLLLIFQAKTAANSPAILPQCIGQPTGVNDPVSRTAEFDNHFTERWVPISVVVMVQPVGNLRHCETLAGVVKLDQSTDQSRDDCR